MPLDSGIDLYWLPLGAGGWFVRFNGRVYESFLAHREHREPLDLYHTALEITVPDGRFVIENAWPIPDGDTATRGVVLEGPVWHPRLARFRSLRYEVRRWPDGTIPDAAEAVASPQRLTDDEGTARRALELVSEVPQHIWGRDELRMGDMWNSNSVISWVLMKSGIPASAIAPPSGGRAPGWASGVAAAGVGLIAGREPYRTAV